MCTFLTATLPAEVVTEVLPRELQKQGFHFTPIANSCVLRQLPATLVYFRITAGHCDCGILLGSQELMHTRSSHEARIRKKAHRNAWSTAKLSRALEESLSIHRRHAELAAEQALQDAREWQNSLASLVKGGIQPLGLLLHFYKTTLVAEQFTINRIEDVPVDSLSPDVLSTFEYDVLYRLLSRKASA